MVLYDYLVHPFADYGFMRRALASCIALAIGGTPLGVFMVLRRMTLVGDAMSHAILPGASLAFLFFGLSLLPMTLGGLVAGLLVAILAGFVTRVTPLKEDASFTGSYLLSLAAGVLIISMKGSSIDLIHVLFGNVLAVDDHSLLMVAAITSLSTILLALIYRSLVLECFDPGFLRTVGGRGEWVHQLFLSLMVLNLVAAFQAMGTMMALGVMILPAIVSRFWTRSIEGCIAFSIAFASAASVIGLLLSYHYRLPSGPAIVMTAGIGYLLSIALGTQGGLITRLIPRSHYAS